jgi:hypothetical protein
MVNGDTLGAAMFSSIYNNDPTVFILTATLNIRSFLDSVLALSPYACAVRTPAP